MTEVALHQQAETWSRCAADYEDCFVPLSAGAARAALDAIALRPGERFLDVAAGTGALALEATRRGASVLAVDFAPGMLATLDAKRRREGLDPIETRVMDAHSLALPNAAFDAAGSAFGVVFCAEPDRALAEMSRVLRPEGRVFISALENAPPSKLMRFIVQALETAEPGILSGADLTVSGLSDSKSIVEALGRAGFRAVQSERVCVPWVVANPASWWDRWALTAPPVRAAMSHVPRSVRERARGVFVRQFEGEHLSHGASFEMQVSIVRGIR